MSKKIAIIFLVLLIVILAVIVFFLYKKSTEQVTPPPVTQESVAEELKGFTPDPIKLKDPVIVEKELKSIEIKTEQKLSEEEILKELTNPEIQSLP